MTKEEEREVIRVCGEDYDYWDIPAYIRQKDKKRKLTEEEEARFLSMLEEEYIQRERERRERERIENPDL